MNEETKYAEFDQLNNDLFWTFWHSEWDMSKPEGSKHHFSKIKWTGYNDDFWWSNIATKEGQNVRQCECGKKFALDYDTNEVKHL